MNYYNPPYGYQLNGVSTDFNQIQTTQIDQSSAASGVASNMTDPATQNHYQPSQSSYTTYMQSGTGTTASTHTTKSGNTYDTSSQQTPTTPKHRSKTDANTTPARQPKNVTRLNLQQPKRNPATYVPMYVDLLTDIDCTQC